VVQTEGIDVMRLTGRLLEIEDYSGDFRGEQGEVVQYSGKRLHVLDGREVIKVKVPKALQHSHGLVEGDEVDLRVSVTANTGARGAYLTTQLLGDFGAPRLSAVAD
jgi:hypothetical protein